MDGFIFFIFLIFFVFPFLKKISSASKKTGANYKQFSKKMNSWGMDHGQVKQRRHEQLHSQDNSQVFPEDHAARVRARDKRDRKEFMRMETNIHSRVNKAMTKVSNKSQSGWGSKGESGLTSSKAVLIVFLLLVLAYLIISAFAPDLLTQA